MFFFSEIRHHWYEHADLNARSLQSELLTNHKFADVDLIYPDIDLEVLTTVYTFMKKKKTVAM